MKKMTRILTFVCTFVLMFFGFAGGFAKVATAESDVQVSEEIYSQIMNELSSFLNFTSGSTQHYARFPGSKAELSSALYIKAQLAELSTFEAVENQSTTNGVQGFEFISNVDNMTKTSQNIVFCKKTQTASKKKVVLATHYDMMPIDKNEENAFSTTVEYLQTAGINESGFSVATLLALARMIDQKDDLGFSVELVFFGANNNNYAGSKFYAQGLDDTDAGNILLVLNLDKIGLGDYNYFYMNEFENSQSEYVSNLIGGKDGFKQLALKNVLHFSQQSPNGLDYTHIGLESDHAVFLGRNVNVVNLFSGSYENFATVGRNEYDGKENITYTQNDDIVYLMANYDLQTNLVNVYQAVETLIFDQNFVSEMEKDNGEKLFYGTYTNDKLAMIVTVVLFFVLVVVFNVIYVSLKNKSRKMIGTSDSEQIAIKIIKNIGEDNDEFNDFIDKKIKDDTEDKKQ